MLVDFVVKNFGPFKDEAILTMTAQKGTEHPENYVGTNAAGNVLTSAAIFGPNAAGKTYLFEALGCLQRMIISPGPPNAPIVTYFPFRLSKDTKEAPIKMNIRFITDGVLYDYHILYDRQAILEERLFHYPNGKKAEVFTRAGGKLEFGRSARGQSAISKLMSPNTTCVFTAAQFNNEICRKVHNWFLNSLVVLADYREEAVENILLQNFVDRINKDENLKKRVMNAMRVADFAITDIHGTVKKRKVQDIPGISPQAKALMPVADAEEIFETELFLTHDVGDDSLTAADRTFPLGIESAGTIRFISIISLILDALTEGATIVIDEFGQKLHSRLSRWIVEQFCDRSRNTGGGQFIFNTNSNHLMDQDILRRDQIYLVDKNERGESELFSISDFGERKDRVILASYMDGKYGAVPFIDEGTPL